ncbi:hypothetical protein RFI_11174, partial [Reticulomyxa filosa]
KKKKKKTQGPLAKTTRRKKKSKSKKEKNNVDNGEEKSKNKKGKSVDDDVDEREAIFVGSMPEKLIRSRSLQDTIVPSRPLRGKTSDSQHLSSSVRNDLSEMSALPCLSLCDQVAHHFASFQHYDFSFVDTLDDKYQQTLVAEGCPVCLRNDLISSFLSYLICVQHNVM